MILSTVVLSHEGLRGIWLHSEQQRQRVSTPEDEHYSEMMKRFFPQSVESNRRAGELAATAGADAATATHSTSCVCHSQPCEVERCCGCWVATTSRHIPATPMTRMSKTHPSQCRSKATELIAPSTRRRDGTNHQAEPPLPEAQWFPQLHRQLPPPPELEEGWLPGSWALPQTANKWPTTIKKFVSKSDF